MIAIISDELRVLSFTSLSKFNFEFNFTLPTSERSYLSLLKYKFLKTSSAISTVGASPGLNTLYISFRASVLFVFLSIFKVSSR